MIELEREGNVFVLTMNDGENRWNTTFVREYAKALDEVEALQIDSLCNRRACGEGQHHRGEGARAAVGPQEPVQSPRAPYGLGGQLHRREEVGGGADHCRIGYVCVG